MARVSDSTKLDQFRTFYLQDDHSTQDGWSNWYQVKREGSGTDHYSQLVIHGLQIEDNGKDEIFRENFNTYMHVFFAIHNDDGHLPANIQAAWDTSNHDKHVFQLSKLDAGGGIYYVPMPFVSDFVQDGALGNLDHIVRFSSNISSLTIQTDSNLPNQQLIEYTT